MSNAARTPVVIAARTPVVIVAGLAAAAHDVADALLDAHTAVVHPNLTQLPRGVLVRRLRRGTDEDTTVVQLAHGCVSCTLRGNCCPCYAA